jgi:radical SAM peptide maturase (CXXX-repeat target family)
MKETNALYKKIKLYNQQFDIFEMQTFGYHKTTRLRYEADAISFRINYMYDHNKDLDKIPELHEKLTSILDEVRYGFCEIVAVFLNDIIESSGVSSYNIDNISEVIVKHIDFKNQEIGFDVIILSDDENCLNYIDDKIKDDEVFNIMPNQFFRFNVESYSDAIQKVYPELFTQDTVDPTNKDTSIYVHNFTFQTTEDCNLSCTYCYQINKTCGRMKFPTAKAFIDKLLNDEYSYINKHNSPAIIIEFIGGDPLLEINLTKKIYEYFLERCYELNHPWFAMHRISICTNGMLYFDRDVQDFFKKYAKHVSFNISIDGNKELQDSCRIQPNGEGSYDIDILALNHFNKYHTTERNSKMTLAPENMKYLYDSVINFINEDMESINLNCVFEDVWTQETATLEYEQLKKLANYLLENNLEHLYIAIFDDKPETRLKHTSDQNWCGGLGSMLALDYKGKFYPCIRYMPSSLGTKCKEQCIGHIDTGMVGREEGSEILSMMDSVTRRSQSNDICYDCPIGSSCSWCSGLCHQTYGTANKRTQFICLQMFAEHLANVYYWNLLAIKKPHYNLGVRKLQLPDEWALMVINEEELKLLKMIVARSTITVLENQ